MPPPGSKWMYLDSHDMNRWNYTPHEHGKRFHPHIPSRNFCDYIRIHGFFSIPDLKMTGFPWAHHLPMGHTIYNSRPCKESGHTSEFAYELICGTEAEKQFYQRISDILETQLSVLVDYEEIENTTKGLAFFVMPESLEPDMAILYPDGYPIFSRYKIPLNIIRCNPAASLAYAKVLEIRLNITFIGSYIQFHRHITLFTDENVSVYENPNPPPLPKPVLAKMTLITKGKTKSPTSRSPASPTPESPGEPQPSGSKSRPKTAAVKPETKESKSIDLPVVERKKRERTPSSSSSHSRSSSCSSTESRQSARVYQDKVVGNRPPTPGTLQEEANAPLALHPRKSEERALLKSDTGPPQRPHIRNPNKQDYKATTYLAQKEDVRREDARRHGEKKSRRESSLPRHRRTDDSLPRRRDTSLPRKSQRDKTEPEVRKPVTKEVSSKTSKLVHRRPIPHSISHIFETLSKADQDAMLKTIYQNDP
jgi:hypothetical protein